MKKLNKKDLPLAVLKALEPFLSVKDPRYEIVQNNEALLRFEDTDPDSSFYFEIEKSAFEKAKTLFTVAYFPANQAENKVQRLRMEALTLGKAMEKWVNILQGYEEVNSIYDDPILKKNEEEFTEILKITDEDADRVGFNLDQINYLDAYLTNVTGTLEAHKNDESEFSVNDIEELTTEVESIRKVLTKETKSQVVSRLSKFFAKCKKVGLPIIKDVFVNISVELIKKLMLGP